MKELQQVANVYRELAQLYIIRRSKPAYKTGNLYNRVGEYNTFQRMLTKNPTRAKSKIPIKVEQINLPYFAPGGAKYGRFVEEGTVNMDARPFAKEAANDRRLKQTIDKAMKGVIDDEVLPQIRKQVDKAFIKFLSKK